MWANMNPMDCIIEPSEELGGLYLGNIEAARDYSTLIKNEIRAVLTAADGTGLRYPEEVIAFHEIYPADDVESYDMSQYFEKAIDFIDRHRKYTNVFGVSRSAALVCAYVMKKSRWPYEKTLVVLQEKRKQVLPNPGFMRQLRNFERIL